jgi:hypothetical protein
MVVNDFQYTLCQSHIWESRFKSDSYKPNTEASEWCKPCVLLQCVEICKPRYEATLSTCPARYAVHVVPSLQS